MISSLLAVTLALLAPEISGRVVSITDGDTLVVLVDENQVKIRLEGIDAPESRQAFGTQARAALGDYVFGKSVKVVTYGKDRYGRTLGVIFHDGENINARLVANGFAWHYKQYSSDPELDRLEREARAAKRGLWRDPNPVEPWNYRKRPKPKAASRVSLKSRISTVEELFVSSIPS